MADRATFSLTERKAPRLRLITPNTRYANPLRVGGKSESRSHPESTGWLSPARTSLGKRFTGLAELLTLSFPNSHLALRARRLESQPCSKVVAGELTPFLRGLFFSVYVSVGLASF